MDQLIAEGVFVGPAGQLVEIVYPEGPDSWHDPTWMYSVDGQCYQELDKEIVQLLWGYEYLGELGEVEDEDYE